MSVYCILFPKVLQDKYKQLEAAISLRDSVFHSIKSVFEKPMKKLFIISCNTLIVNSFKHEIVNRRS